uniref:Uncharacterized protein n=1 Tax=Anguilla anguilla TaxID=7936 RepID=A0A0E9RZA6_ANGAN
MAQTPKKECSYYCHSITILSRIAWSWLKMPLSTSINGKTLATRLPLKIE